jgi:hypothetical protein
MTDASEARRLHAKTHAIVRSREFLEHIATTRADPAGHEALLVSMLLELYHMGAVDALATAQEHFAAPT